MSLANYRTLGRSGLAVSPLALGTMTFGTARWGTSEDDSKAVFNAYVDAGGNLIDTADVYSAGRGEEMVGKFIAERSLRDRIVLATKSGFSAGQGPHNGGNGAKHIFRAVEGSLQRMQTDYIDLYWIHVWDSITPAEELLETMTTLVRSGKIRYWECRTRQLGILPRLPRLQLFVACQSLLRCSTSIPSPIATLKRSMSLWQKSLGSA